MKKQKLPKYVQAIFRKPQFKVGDRVKFESLGDRDWETIKIRLFLILDRDQL